MEKIDMAMIGKRASLTVGVGLLLACSSSEREQNLSPNMQKALQALAEMPVSVRQSQSVAEDEQAGATDRVPTQTTTVEKKTTFGDTDEGGEIVKGIGSQGPTGNGPGSGGVGQGNGPGNGGVGGGTGPGNGGVGGFVGAGGGGVAFGPSGGGASDLASVVCDFLNAFCVSIAKCTSEEVDLECNFGQNECVEFVNALVEKSEAPISIPPQAISGIRCVSNALRSTNECLFTEESARGLESKIRACGLPIGEREESGSDSASTND